MTKANQKRFFKDLNYVYGYYGIGNFVEQTCYMEDKGCYVCLDTLGWTRKDNWNAYSGYDCGTLILNRDNNLLKLLVYTYYIVKRRRLDIEFREIAIYE